jgi:hypothetical protein
VQFHAQGGRRAASRRRGGHRHQRRGGTLMARLALTRGFEGLLKEAHCCLCCCMPSALCLASGGEPRGGGDDGHRRQRWHCGSGDPLRVRAARCGAAAAPPPEFRRPPGPGAYKANSRTHVTPEGCRLYFSIQVPSVGFKCPYSNRPLKPLTLYRLMARFVQWFVRSRNPLINLT